MKIHVNQDNDICCKFWSSIRAELDWFTLVEDPKLLVLPHMKFPNNVMVTVKHCPYCGEFKGGYVWDTRVANDEEFFPEASCEKQTSAYVTSEDRRAVSDMDEPEDSEQPEFGGLKQSPEIPLWRAMETAYHAVADNDGSWDEDHMNYAAEIEVVRKYVTRFARNYALAHDTFDEFYWDLNRYLKKQIELAQRGSDGDD